MQLEKRIVTLLLIFGLIHLTTYSLAAIRVSRYAFVSDGRFYWCSTGPGSFFPWPNEPGPFQAISDMNAIDAVSYTLLIQTGFLPGATVVLLIGFARLVPIVRERRLVL